MMRRLVFIGSIAALLTTGSAHAQSLYGTMKQLTEQRIENKMADLKMEPYLIDVIEIEDVTLTEDMIDQAMQGDLSTTDLCLNAGGTPSKCEALEGDIRREAERVRWIRELAVDMQLITASYELNADGYTGREDRTMTMMLQGVANIWRSGVDELISYNPAGKIRTAVLDDPTVVDGPIGDLQGALSALRETGDSYYGDQQESLQKVASAVHRYRHGFQEVKNEGSCDDGVGDGTPLELLTVRWCDVEDALEDIWDELPHDSDEFDPELEPNEVAVFPTRTLGGLNIVVWMRNDDVGIIWDIPMEPVLPGLLSLDDDVLEYGEYDEPEKAPLEEKSICSHPLGKRGYLCRVTEQPECPTETDPPVEVNKIQLVGCVVENTQFPKDITESGPNICMIGGWREPLEGGNFSGDDWSGGDDVPDQCKNCNPILKCGTTWCTDWGNVRGKRPNGDLEICASDGQIPAQYIFIKELVRAQNMCHKEPGAQEPPDDAQDCCSQYWMPSLAACTAMAKDGIFDETDFTPDECASILTNKSCEANFGPDSCSVIPLDPDRVQEMIDTANEEPKSCPQARFEFEPRIRSLVESFPVPCDPNCKVRYENTIGNNLCYISQCIEQSTERDRILPGRVPFVTQDQKFAWDACISEPKPIGDLAAVPGLQIANIPPYRGEQIIKEFERALCNIGGGATSPIPAECEMPDSVTFGLPLSTYASTAERALSQKQLVVSEMDAVSRSMSNVASRIGTELYLEYMNTGIRYFNDLINSLNGILQGMGDISFPTMMCSRYNPQGCFTYDAVSSAASSSSSLTP